MTKFKIFSTISVVALSLVAIVTGCTTVSTNQNNIALEQFAITSAVSIGTAEILSQSNGAQYKPDFVLAESVLNGISTGTNTLTTAQVSAALTQAGVKDAIIAPIVINGLNLADKYSANGTNATVQEITGWISAGINQGLGQ
jgi:hypothetical protein